MMMKQRTIGKTKLKISEIGFGGASIGNLYSACTDAAARNTISTCLDLGINFFDTAPEYGHGLSERRLGDALREMPREHYVLATKVGDILSAVHDRLPPANKFVDKLPFHLHYDYTYDGIMRAFDASLHRLGLNKIDILLVHDLDPVIHDANNYPLHFKNYIESGYKALQQLRNDKVIDAIGLGVKKWEVCAEAMKYGDYDCFMLQGNYTLLDHDALDSFMPVCEQKQISILLAGPFASGILATGPTQNAHYNHVTATQEIIARVKRLQEICLSHQVPLQAAAIQFPLKHPSIASVVIGSASSTRTAENCAYLQTNIPQTFWNDLKNAYLIPQHAPTSL